MERTRDSYHFVFFPDLSPQCLIYYFTIPRHYLPKFTIIYLANLNGFTGHISNAFLHWSHIGHKTELKSICLTVSRIKYLKTCFEIFIIHISMIYLLKTYIYFSFLSLNCFYIYHIIFLYWKLHIWCTFQKFVSGRKFYHGLTRSDFLYHY